MSFPTFTFNGYDTKKTGDMFNIKNNGHTLQITITNYTGMSVQGFGTYFMVFCISSVGETTSCVKERYDLVAGCIVSGNKFH